MKTSNGKGHKGNGAKGSKGGAGPKSSPGNGAAKVRPGRQSDTDAARKIADEQAKMADQGAEHIGDLVSWNCPDSLDVPRADVRALFGQANLEKLLPDLAPPSALRRAISEGKAPKGLFAMEFEAASDDRACAHGIYRKRGAGEGGDDMICVARVRIDGETAVALPPEGKAGEEEGLAWAASLVERANHLIENCAGRDVSGALVKVAAHFKAVPLRERGGFYLLPPASCSTWASLVPELRRLGFWMITIQMHGSPTNLAACGEAAKGSLEADLEELARDLEKAQTEGLRISSLEHRIKMIEELGAKAELYRGVLAGAAEGITAQMAALKVAFEKKLDEDKAAISRGDKPAVSSEVAAKRSAAALKAHATRKAKKEGLSAAA